MTTFAVAGIQMQVSGTDDNLRTMDRYAAVVRHRFPWVGMLLFSELAAFGPDPNNAVPLPGDIEARLCGIARRHGFWLVPGSLFERRNGRTFNTAPVISPSGEVVARYRKVFPFRPYEHGIDEGGGPVVFDVPGAGRFGISICYDMWFPETTRQLAAMGAEVILHPTMTDTIDRDIELAVARSSAAQNQCYFFDINGLGAGGCGQSIVVDSAGYVLHQAGTSDQIIPIDIDFVKIRRERQRGLRGLGQVLKSFRDRESAVPFYRREAVPLDYLETLGPLEAQGATGSELGPKSGADL